MFSYREILKKAFLLAWQGKNLWFFGLFASLLSFFGGYSIVFSSTSNQWKENIFALLADFADKDLIRDFLVNFGMILKQYPFSAFILVVFLGIIITLYLFLLWLAIVSQAGLISNCAKKIKGEKEVLIKEGVEIGVKKFWPILALNLLLGGFIFVFSAIIGLPLFFISPENGGIPSLIYIILFIVLMPVAVIVSLLLRYSTCLVVIKNEKFSDSIVKAWKLLIKNWLISLEIFLITLAVDLFFVLVVIISLLTLAIPYMFFSVVISALVGVAVYPILIFFGYIVAIIAFITAAAALMVFKTSAWTDVFIRLAEKKNSLSKIIRLAESFKK